MLAAKPHIVILGAGYGGIVTVKRIAKQLSTNDANITLISKHDYHYQTTWLHEPAAGTLHHDRTRMKIADLIPSHVQFIEDEVVEIHPKENKVSLKNNEQVTYDYLVTALGSVAETFGVEGVYEYAFNKWTLNGARELREHTEYMFAKYNNEQKEEYLTFVVAGAGFTGIEYIGELSERMPELCKEFDVPMNKVKMYVIEAAPTALPGFDPELVEYAMNLLENRGVEFKINMPISKVTEDGVILKDGTEIKAGTVIWATGVRGNPVIEKSGFENMRGRVKVTKDLRAPDYDNVFIIGDCSLIINEQTDRPYPPTAQIATQQAEVAARNLANLVKGRPLEEFQPDIKGTVASLGGNKKVFGFSANFMKKMIDNRSLWMIGGTGLVIKKGKNPF